MVSKKQPVVYTDTPVFLNVIYREPGLWPDSYKVLAAFERGDIEMVASTLLHAELAGWTGRVEDNSAAQATLQGYLDSQKLRIVELDLTIVRSARALAAQHHLRGCDAVHLATAIKMDADFMFTRDDRLLRVGSKIKPLVVKRPSVIWTPTLDDHQIETEAAAERKQSSQARSKPPREAEPRTRAPHPKSSPLVPAESTNVLPLSRRQGT